MGTGWRFPGWQPTASGGPTVGEGSLKRWQAAAGSSGGAWEEGQVRSWGLTSVLTSPQEVDDIGVMPQFAQNFQFSRKVTMVIF